MYKIPSWIALFWVTQNVKTTTNHFIVNHQATTHSSVIRYSRDPRWNSINCNCNRFDIGDKTRRNIAGRHSGRVITNSTKMFNFERRNFDARSQQFSWKDSVPLLVELEQKPFRLNFRQPEHGTCFSLPCTVQIQIVYPIFFISGKRDMSVTISYLLNLLLTFRDCSLRIHNPLISTTSTARNLRSEL